MKQRRPKALEGSSPQSEESKSNDDIYCSIQSLHVLILVGLATIPKIELASINRDHFISIINKERKENLGYLNG